MTKTKEKPKQTLIVLDQDEADRRDFDWGLLRRLLAHLKPYRKQVLLMYFLSATTIACTLTWPYLIKLGIDNHIKTGDYRGLMRLSALFLALLAVQFFAQRGHGATLIRLGQQAVRDLRRDLFNHLEDLSFSFFDKQKAGRIMVRVTNDVNSLEEILSGGLNTIFTDTFLLLGMVGVMLWLDMRLSLILFITIPLILLLVFVVRRRMLAVTRIVRRKLSAVNAYLNESILGIKVTQAFAREEANSRMFREINQDHFESMRRFVPLNSFFWMGINILNSLGTVLVLLGGGILLSWGLITLGTIAAFMNYINRFFWPMQNLSTLMNQISTAMASCERIFDLMDLAPEVRDRESVIALKNLRGEVEFRGVGFAYNAEEMVLTDFGLQIRAGESIALVGPTGAGKSTVINLLCRFYDPQWGEVRVDGMDLRDLRQQEYRSRIAVVLQDTFIFSGTVLDNIRFGNPAATGEQVEEVARKLGIHEMIMKLPQGYHTELQERGSRLSVGEKQLMAFARAMIRDPKILILDEATAYIDTRTERMIQRALEVAMQDRTTVIIAHRLSTVRKVDRIIVINNGRIAEEGTHEQLLAMNGVYRNLYESQFKNDVA
ncbi:MAG: ABC transporter ATP-binding protein [Bacillota bacterium]